MSSTIQLVFLFSLGVWIIQVLVRSLTGPLSKVPGPWYTRLTGLPLKYASITGRRIYFVDALHHKYGDMVLVAPKEISCNSPAMFKEVHRHGNGFRKAPWYKKFSGYVDVDENYSLLAIADPKIHAARRKLMARAFSKAEIRKNWEADVRGKVEYAVKRMGEVANAHPGGEVDVLQWWKFMASDVSSRVVFGESFDMLHTGKKKNDYLLAAEQVAKADGIVAELTILKYIPILATRKLFRTPNIALDWPPPSLLTAANGINTSGPGNVFTNILAEAEKKGSPLTDVVLTRQARSLILAGIDTTSTTLTYLIWSVASLPQLRDQLVAELRKDAGDERTWTDEKLEKLPLLSAVIQESLRLYCAVPGSLPRTPPPGGAAVGGMHVSDDMVVSTQAWSLHRHPRIWERPKQFDVSRWLPGAELSEEAKSAFNPWGGGARVCLGIHIAEMQLRYGASLFFLRHPNARVAPGTTEETMKPDNFFIITPKARECRVILS